MLNQIVATIGNEDPVFKMHLFILDKPLMTKITLRMYH